MYVCAPHVGLVPTEAKKRISDPFKTGITGCTSLCSGDPHSSPHVCKGVALTSEQSHCHRKFVVLDFVVVAF